MSTSALLYPIALAALLILAALAIDSAENRARRALDEIDSSERAALVRMERERARGMRTQRGAAVDSSPLAVVVCRIVCTYALLCVGTASIAYVLAQFVSH